MRILQIPDVFKPGFRDLIKLSDNQVDQFIEVIKGLPVGFGEVSFNKALISNLDFDVSEIAASIYSLGAVLISQNESVDIISKEIANSYKDSEDVEDDDQINSLRERLFKILNNCDNLKRTFKAIYIGSENEHTFRDARIFSDIRIVFGDELDIQNQNAVIIHQLKIEYQEANEYKEFYVCLDSSDLLKLKSQVQRAIDKETLIRTTNNSPIRFIEITE